MAAALELQGIDENFAVVSTIDAFCGGTIRGTAQPVVSGVRCLGTQNKHKKQIDARTGDCRLCLKGIAGGINTFTWSDAETPSYVHCKDNFVNRNTTANVITGELQRQWRKIMVEFNDPGGVAALHHDSAVRRKCYMLHPGKLRLLLAEFTHIIVDEAQDLTPCEARLFAVRHPGKVTVVVGDPLQCINQFRGAYAGLMESLDADHEFTLPRTYRYGFPLNRLVEKMVREWTSASNAQEPTLATFRIDTALSEETKVVQVGTPEDFPWLPSTT